MSGDLAVIKEQAELLLRWLDGTGEFTRPQLFPGMVTVRRNAEACLALVGRLERAEAALRQIIEMGECVSVALARAALRDGLGEA